MCNQSAKFIEELCRKNDSISINQCHRKKVCMGEAVKVKRQEGHFKHMQTWTFLDPALNRPIKKIFLKKSGKSFNKYKAIII